MVRMTPSPCSTSSSISRPQASELRAGVGGAAHSQGASHPLDAPPVRHGAQAQAGDDSLQIVDEEVELADVLVEARAAGLQLLSYNAYDVFAGSPEYQLMVLSPARGRTSWTGAHASSPTQTPTDRRAPVVRMDAPSASRGSRCAPWRPRHGTLVSHGPSTVREELTDERRWSAAGP